MIEYLFFREVSWIKIIIGIFNCYYLGGVEIEVVLFFMYYVLFICYMNEYCVVYFSGLEVFSDVMFSCFREVGFIF